MTAERRGTVASFDPAVGLGKVDGGAGRFLFHCTQIADGTRTITPGTEVTFRVVAARHGRWEAVELSPSSTP